MNERRRAAAHAFVDDLAAPVLDPTDAHHLVRVLRLGVGEIVTVSDGAGSWRSCTHSGGGTLDPSGEVRFDAPRAVCLSVGFAVMKGDRPEWVVQKLTELGVDRIMPLHTDRSVVRWNAERATKHVERLRRVAREAAMQSRQVWMPVIDDLSDLSTHLSATGTALAEPDGRPLTLLTPTVVVGPEGGFTPSEVDSGCACVRLPGDGILRADTAALAAGVALVTLRDTLSHT